MRKITVRAVCHVCNGTGLYQGMAERDGCAVICTSCNPLGSGGYPITYEQFVERKKLPKNKIKRVFKNSCGYVHSSKDTEGIAFSQSGCTYEEWLDGKEPEPVRELYCPFEWTAQDRDMNGLYNAKCEKTLRTGSLISKCSCRDEKAVCWAIFEGVDEK